MSIAALTWPKSAITQATIAAPVRTVPPIEVVRGSNGAPGAQYDAARMDEVCRSAGLPSLPDMRGADPVPVRTMTDALSRWIDGGDASAIGDVGRIAVALGMEPEALPYFLAASELDADNAEQWRYFAGICCQRVGQATAARTLLEGVRNDERTKGVVAARLGTLALEDGDLDRAQSQFNACSTISPNDSIAWFGLAQVALARGDATTALKMLETALRVRPSDTRAARLRARTLALLGRVEDSAMATAQAAAMPEYFGWLAFDERLREAHAFANTISHNRTGLMRAVGQKDWPKAIAIGEDLRSRQPADAPIIVALAAAYLSGGRTDDSLKAAQQAAALAPRDPGVQRTVAEISLTQNRFAECIVACDAILAFEPQSVRAIELKARAVFMLGDRAQGIILMTHAVAAQPANLPLRLALATMLQQTGQVSEARAVLQEVLRIDPTNRAAATQLLQLPAR